MTGWIRWTAPAAAMISLSAPAHAVQYLSVSEAQKLAFPSASFTEVQPGRVWKTSSGGIFVLDHVIGKHLYIDYAVSIDPAAASTASISCNTGSPMAARSEARAGWRNSSARPAAAR